MSKFHQFRINYTSDETGEVFEGNFSCRRQSILDKSRINRRKSELGGGFYCVRDENGVPTGQGIEDEIEWFNYAVAVLETVMESAPPWFKLKELCDEGVIYAIFKEVMDYENSFRRRRRKTLKDGSTGGSSETSSSKEHQESVPSNNPPKMVDKEIQDSLDA